MELEVEVLIAEIKRFLTIHPLDEENDPKKQRKRASQMSELEIDPNESFIPQQIIYCTFHVEAIKNWKLG